MKPLQDYSFLKGVNHGFERDEAALRRLDKVVIDLKDASIDTTMAEQLVRQYKSRGGGEA